MRDEAIDEWNTYDMLNEFESKLYNFQLDEFRKVLAAVYRNNSNALNNYYKDGYKDGYAAGKRDGKKAAKKHN